MGIEAFWKDERGKILGAVEDPDLLSSISDRLYAHPGACARFIDPAGDACFNQLQLPILATELGQVLASLPPGRPRDHLARVVDLVQQAIGRSHTYVWFIGD